MTKPALNKFTTALYLVINACYYLYQLSANELEHDSTNSVVQMIMGNQTTGVMMKKEWLNRTTDNNDATKFE